MHTLFVVGTPIGNLSDITERALKMLREVNAIVCENPRLTQKLLYHYGIRGKRLFIHREENKRRMIPVLLEALEKEDLALVTDAGTPAISDPGAELVDAVWKGGGRVVAIPGPSAMSAALSIAGIRVDTFLFLGFLPRQEGKLKKILTQFLREGIPVVSFEAPHRILRTLSVLKDLYPDAFVVVAKELTKMHERVLRGTPDAVLREFESDPDLKKGEFVLMVKIAS